MAFRLVHVVAVGLIGLAIVIVAGICAGGYCVRDARDADPTDRSTAIASFINSIRPTDKNLSYPPQSNASPEEQALAYLIDIDPAAIDAEETKRLRQRYALLSLLYHQSSNSDWEAEGWASALHECEWDEISCEAHTVTKLSLCCDSLRGTIPEDLALLTAVTSFDLGGNFLTGPFPESLAQLTNLQQFFVGGNSLTGTLPELHWPSLTVFDIHRNNLTGTVRLTQDKPILKTALVHANQMSGELDLCPEQRLVADCGEFSLCPCCGEYCCPNANLTECGEAHDRKAD